MVDPGTGLAVLGSGVLTHKLIEKVLGPTAEYIGDGLKNFTQKRVDNLGRVFKAAERKLLNPGKPDEAVPPRVLGETLRGASFADDSVITEYFGGVLASSRTGISRDDRGTTFAALIGRLSTYQVRAHYIIYSIVRSYFVGTFAATQGTLLVDSCRDACTLFIPMNVFLQAMALEEGEDPSVVISHTLVGLAKEDLIDGNGYAYGNVEHVRRIAPAADSAGAAVKPTAVGAELFLWANGLGHASVADFFDPSLPIQPLAEVEISEGSFSAHSGRQKRLSPWVKP